METNASGTKLGSNDIRDTRAVVRSSSYTLADDRLVYELYGLSDEEIGIVEEAAGEK